jgi:ABC-type multidrug transport system ATPase subunit
VGVRDLIVEASRERGRTVLLSTHNLAEAELLCDRVAIMRFGRLLTVGSPADLRRSLGDAVGVRIETADGDTAAVHRLHQRHRRGRRSRHPHGRDRRPGRHPGAGRRLVARGVAIHRVDPIEPTLEDLYISLHEQSPRDPEVAR